MRGTVSQHSISCLLLCLISSLLLPPVVRSHGHGHGHGDKKSALDGKHVHDVEHIKEHLKEEGVQVRN